MPSERERTQAASIVATFSHKQEVVAAERVGDTALDSLNNNTARCAKPKASEVAGKATGIPFKELHETLRQRLGA